MNQSALAVNPLFEHVLKADSPLVMTAIYEPHINLVVWQRQLSNALDHYIAEVTQGLNALQLRTVITPDEVSDWLTGLLPDKPQRNLFVDDVRQLVEMYADLFELNSVGLRLSLIHETMCPIWRADW